MITRLYLLFLLLISHVPLAGAAELKLAALFSDHIVLQREKPVPVWGWAEPGEEVFVEFAGRKKAGVADASGKWMVKLDSLPANAEPHELVVSTARGSTLRVRDVLVGEVWLGSGQSNMAMPVRSARDFDHERAIAALPMIRMFKEESQGSAVARTNATGQWVVSSPSTVGAFSAALYFFGRDLHRELNVPIGLVNSSVGGTPIETWMALEAQARIPQLQEAIKNAAKEEASFDAAKEKAAYEQALKVWAEQASTARAAGARIPAKPVDMVEQRIKRGGPGGLFNGKIAPLIPYAMRGAIWYQGEANAQPGKGAFYEYQLPVLIADWRARWGDEFSFAWVQLPNFRREGNDWSLVREGMLKALRLPRTGMAVTVDIGENSNIHPRNKQEVGRRLSLWALGEVYGKSVPATSGPLPMGQEVRGSEVILRFVHCEGGLKAGNGSLEGFIVAGEDRQWKPAQARIAGDTVVVTSPQVSRPVSVRYAWASDPVCNLFNGAGLPASPFRTDAWPMIAARPNIIVLVADDMRWDALSCAGHPLLHTLNLDRLATSGTRFNNAYVTTSICCVSRASILTGQYARRHGVNDFKTPIMDLESTYAARLRHAGYWTGFVGKWGTGQGDREYFQRCAASFDFWAGDMGQSSYWHERTCNYITNNGTSDRTNFFCSCPLPARRGEGCGTNGAHASLKDPVHAETEFVPSKIRSFLDQRDMARPFCLSVSFKAPHAPWRGYAPRFGDDFKDREVPRRGNVTLEDALRQPEFLRRSLESERGMRFVTNSAARNELFHQYYRLVEGMDFCVGELLQELEARGVATNTVILFTSDNGHFAGEHGFFGKWFMHEESLRVPMVICDPRMVKPRRAQVSDAMVLNLDLAPTILELAGLPVPDAMQGRSLLPLLRNPGQLWRNEFFYEHLYRHGPNPPLHIEPSEGVRTADWKYIRWIDQAGPDSEELYDLRADPLEMNNLARVASSAAKLEELRRKHARWLEDTK